MESKYSIPLSDVIKEFQLEVVYMPKEPEKIMISSPEVTRPGLALAGFTEVFEPFRIQILGRAEHAYLNSLSDEEHNERISSFFEHNPVAVIVTSGLPICEATLQSAKGKGIPLMRTEERTSAFMAAIISSLNTTKANQGNR